MSDESADRSGKPRRYYFDDLADSEDFAEPAGDLVDTGPIQVIRDPLPGSAAGRQLHFDDIDDPTPPPAQDEDDDEPVYTAAAPLGDEPPRRGILAGSGRRPRPIGAILAVVAVLALVGVIAAIGGQGHKDNNAKHSGTHTDAALSTPRPSHPNSGPTQSPTESASSTAPSTSASRHKAVTKTPADIPLTVLNNTIKTGLAAQAAHLFSTKGWRIGAVGNYTGQLSVTTVYYSPTDPAERRAAETLAAQFPDVAQVQPRLANLPGSGLTVVLAPDWP